MIQSGNWRGARDQPENWEGHVMQVTVGIIIFYNNTSLKNIYMLL